MKLLTLSGFVPEQICDSTRFTRYSGERNISHYCGYASDFISQVIQDETVDGAVFPRSCDSCRVINSYLSDCGKFKYQLNVPARQDEIAVEYFASVIKDYQKSLEDYFHVTVSDVVERAEAINIRNQKLREIYDGIDTVSYGDYLKSIHRMLTTPLFEQKVPTSLAGRAKTDKRVFLVGSFLSNDRIAEIIENAGMTVVGDNLTESGRLISAPRVDSGGDLYKSIAGSILKNRLSPSQNNFADILSKDLGEMKQKDVRGVIFVTQRYCEPYDYLFSVYKKMLDEREIPVVRVTLTDSEDSKKAELVIEAFADML